MLRLKPFKHLLYICRELDIQRQRDGSESDRKKYSVDGEGECKCNEMKVVFMRSMNIHDLC